MSTRVVYNKFIVTHSYGRVLEAVHLWGEKGEIVGTKYVETKGDIYRAGNAFLIPNHYSHALTSYTELYNEAKKAFPHLKAKDVECRTVIKSRWCKGMPIIRFSCKPDRIVEGYINCEGSLPDIEWD